MARQFVKQHIVPKRYLDRFADENNVIGTRHIKKGKITIFAAATKDVGYIKNFYDVTDKDDPKYWEHYFAEEIDTLCGAKLGRIISAATMSRDGVIVLGIKGKEVLSRIIIAQMMRIPASVEYMKAVYKRVAPVVKADALGVLPDSFREKYGKQIAELELPDQWKKEQFFNYAFEPGNFEKYWSILRDRTWVVYVNSCRNPFPFITGDNPVLVEGIGKNELGLFHNGLALPSTIIYFPLSPSIAVVNYSRQGMFSLVADEIDGKKFVLGEKDIPFIMDKNMKIMEQSYQHSFIPQPLFNEVTEAEEE